MSRGRPFQTDGAARVNARSAMTVRNGCSRSMVAVDERSVPGGDDQCGSDVRVLSMFGVTEERMRRTA